jgi:hypothetical protein
LSGGAKEQMSYKRSIEELEKRAVKWWPPELQKQEKSVSIVPLLLQTQDQFISILKLSEENPTAVFDVITASKFPANLFLKHLVVLADFGGEQIQRLNLNFNIVFPSEMLRARFFEFFWHEKKHEYHFARLPLLSILNNSKLGIDGKDLAERQPLDGMKRDMIMILLFGSNSSNSAASELLHKCEIGNLLGKPEDLEKYVRQKYIWVSRITGGAESNTLGQVAQQYVLNFLKNNLPKDFKVLPNGHVTGVAHNDKSLTTFDIVVERDSKSVAIEVSFQVTTNSVIERKSTQAKARYDLIKSTGNYIAYVVDGAGNFQRRSAVTTICSFSDCTVGFSDDEFTQLVSFIQSVLS